MRKAILVFSIIAELATSGLIYTETMQVTNVDDYGIVEMEMSDGNIFEIYGNGEYEVGDFASVLLYSKGTDTLEDDIILSVHNSGFGDN